MSLKADPLVPGDLVALAAPAGLCNPDRLARGVAILESWGLRVRPLPDAPPHRYFSSDDDARAAHLGELFADPEVRAILCVRGGFGTARLHRRFLAEAARADPKIFVGFSDISLLLSRIWSEAGLVCFHGPMVAADLPQLTDGSRERFRRFLFGGDDWWNGGFGECWREGVGEGPLVGGCLSLLVTTLGTPYEIDTRGAVLFLEDVAERPYRMDRMLTHLAHAGKLDDLAAVVLGPMLDCDDADHPVLREIVMEALGDRACPVVSDFDAGHGSQNVVLPLGCRVRVDSGHGAVELLESPLATGGESSR